MKNNSTLVKNLLSDFRINIYFQNISLMLIGTLVLAFSSKVQVPFWPVPMTMQTFIVFIIGMAYGWKLAFSTLVIYLLEGALGLPVFASGGGIVYLTGPTAGYLYGMTASVVLISYLANKGYTLTYLKTTLTLLLASVIIFSIGIFYLGSIIGYEKAIQAGLLPFIPSEIFKIALAVAILPTLHNFLKTK